ncbi:MAG: ATP-binding protein, partial [Pseudomonadota bacterium]
SSGVALGFAFVSSRRRAGWRDAAVRDLIHRLRGMSGVGAILCKTNGTVLHVSKGVEPPSGTTYRRIGPLLDELIDRPAANLVYRLSQSARVAGFSGELTSRSDGSGNSYLTCQRLPDDLMLWTLLAPEQASRILRDGVVDPLGPAPFPVLIREADGSVSGNACFRRRFGTDLEPVTSRLDLTRAYSGQREVFDEVERGFGIYRIYTIRREGGRGEEILFLPHDATAVAQEGASAGMERLPIGLMQFDLDGRHLWSNKLARQMMNGPVEVGAQITGMFTPLGRSLESLIDDTLATGTSGRGAMMRLTKTTGSCSGDLFRQITLTRSEIDNTDCLLAVVNDANELRNLEDRFAQSQKMEAIGKLAGGVAHDFNNVLTAIRGHCDFVLMNREETDPDYDDLMQILQNSNRAANMVRHLLAFSRQQTLQPTLLSVRDVVSDAHVFLNSVIGERVTLTIDHDRDLRNVMADQHQLEQVLMNLVVNARDAMRSGGTVTLTTRNRTIPRATVQNGVAIAAGDFVEIRVTDSGTGIPEDVIDRMFDPFFTTKAQGQGTGLGLSTVYGIVKQSGGFIFAENNPDGGASLRVLLPALGEAPQELPVERSVEIRRDLTGQASVLLVEDEESIRSVGTRALKQRGYEVFEAASAEDAMEMLDDTSLKVDVLVSDVVMPGMDGPTFAQKARILRPELRLIFMSGYAEDSFRNSEVDKDFLFLPKPFSINELTAKVKEALEEAA